MPLILTWTQTDGCHGASNGSIDLTVTGAIPPVSYKWTGPSGFIANTEDLTGLAPGTYFIIVTDGNGEAPAASVTIADPPALVAIITGQTNSLCFGGSTGSLTVTATGGTAPYSYSWNTTPVQNTNTATALKAGNYTVTVTDANGCITSVSGTVGQPAATLGLSVTGQVNVACFGNSTGSFTVAGTGGTGPYTYSLKGGVFQASGTYSALTAGSYSVAVMDANGCTFSQSINITQPAAGLTFGAPTVTAASCPAKSDGSILISATGGTGAITYSINPNVGTQSPAGKFNGLPAQAYVITATDQKGCTITTSITVGSTSDTTPPVISGCPGPITVFTGSARTTCDQVANWTEPTALDNCGGNMTYTTRSHAPGSVFPVGTTTVTYTFSDFVNPPSICTFTVTVVDNYKPVLSVPSAKNIQCGESSLPANTGQATATDNCGGAVTISYTDAFVNGPCPGTSTIIRTWSARDLAGNTTTGSQTINVSDTQPPVITCTSFSVANPDAIPSSESFVNVSAIDNCGGPVELILNSEEYTGLTGTAGFCPSSVTRKYVAKDQCGNKSAECTQVITVLDNTHCSVCQDIVPFFPVLFTGPAGIWTSPNIAREGICCGAKGPPPPRCIAFNVYLDKDAVGLVFTVLSGAVPGGALYYQVDCGPQTKVGEAICLAGGRFYTLTFCEPGNNPNVYQIESISGLLTSEDLVTRQDARCADTLKVTGVDPSTVTWRVKSPNDQSLLRYLSCTTCTSPIFTPDLTTPLTIVYEVCGKIAGSNLCNNAPIYDCNDVTVTTLPAIAIDFDIDPSNICANSIPVINALVSPVNLNYNYKWIDGSNGTGTLLSTDPFWKPTRAGNYSLVVTETVTGIKCNTATYNFTITFDTLGPTVLAPPNPLVIGCNDPNAMQQITSWLNTATASYSISDGTVITVQPTNDFSGIPMACNQVLTVTFSAKDQCGNISTATRTITVRDTQSPTWTTAAGTLNRTLECSDASGLAAAQALAPVPADNCDTSLTPVKVSGSFAAGACPNSGSYTNTWVVTDACGNVSLPFTQVITIRDTQAPTWTTSAGSLNRNIECNDNSGMANAQALVPVATDNCDNTLVPVKTAGSFIPGSCPQSGSYTNTWVVTDDCGNVSGAFTQVITIADTQAPTWVTLPGDLNMTLDCTDAAGLAAAQLRSPVATDNCDNSLTPVKTSGSFVPGSCPQAGTFTNTWTVSDDCGNVSTLYTQVITIQDLTPPVITGTLPNQNVLGCTAANTPAAVTTAAGLEALGLSISDGCTPDIKLTVTHTDVASGNCPLIITRTYTVTDECGRSAAVDQLFTMERVNFTLPANQGSTIACASLAVAPTLPVVQDKCGTILTPVSVVISPAPACSGPLTYTYTYTDCSGNSNNWVYTYTIAPPTFTLPANSGSTTSCIAGAQIVPTPPSVMNSCGKPLTVSGPVVGPDPLCSGTKTYRWTYTDCTGISAPWVYTYTIAPPTFTLPAAAGSTVTCMAGAHVVPTPPTPVNSCGNPLTVTGPVVGPDPVCSGTKTYTWTFTDCTGASSNWVYTYTIVPAAFTLPSNTGSTVACLAQANIVPTPPNPLTPCGDPLVVSGPVVGPNPVCSGTKTYTWTYTDCTGRSASWIYTYTITPPSFTLPAISGSTVACIAATHVVPTPPSPVNSCGDPLSVTGPVASPDPVCSGIKTYTWTFTDCTGRSTDWVYTYTVTPPTFTLPAPAGSTVSCILGAHTIPTPPAVADNCGNTLIPVGPVAGADPVCSGTKTYTWTYTTCSGASANWVYTYTVAPPTFTLPPAAGSTVNCVLGAHVVPTPPIAVNSCGSPLAVTGPVVGPDPVCSGTKTYTWTYTDCTGTSAKWVYTYTIAPPSFTMPAAGGSTVACKADAHVVPVPPAVVNSCGNALTVTGPVIGADPVCSGIKTYTWTYTDCTGLSAAWVYTYTINPPTFTVPAPAGSTVSCVAAAHVIPAPPTPLNSCGNPIAITGPVVGPDPVCSGTKTYTWTFTDCTGISASWVYTYTINPPTFTLPAAGSSTVACIAAAHVIPVPPSPVNSCGGLLTVAGPIAGPDPVCSGTKTYTWTFTDCTGVSASWVYTYTINPPTFTAPAVAGSTVACIADAHVVPTPPSPVSSCGDLLTRTGPVVGPDPVCSGTKTYTWTFTDCTGKSAQWVYTYTIAPPTFTAPAVAGSTVPCIAAAHVAPTPPAALNSCGDPLTVSGPVVGPDPVCSGTKTYTWTYTDCTGKSTDWIYTYTIAPPTFTLPAAAGSTVNCLLGAKVVPTPPAAVNSCGYPLTVTGPVVGPDPVCSGTKTYTWTYTDCTGKSSNWVYTYTVSPPTFTLPAAAGSTVACITGAHTVPTPPAAVNSCGNPLAVTGPVVGPDPVCSGTKTYTWTYTDCTGQTASWVYTYTIAPPTFTLPASGGSTVACKADAHTVPTPPVVVNSCGNALAVSSPVVGPDPVCSGTKTYTWTYTDCTGTSATWTYTYSITAPTFTVPAPGGSIVACIAAAHVVPTPPSLINSCGDPLLVSGPVAGPDPVCSGTKTYTWTYTDCTGSTMPWVYTYTITPPTFTAPVSSGSTVACIANAQVVPTPPSPVNSCGDPLTVSGPVVGPDPVCSGTKTYTWTFTDCTGNSTDWVYTYTITPPIFIAPAVTGSTVACIADAHVVPNPPVAVNSCGVPPVVTGPVVGPDPVCSGTKTYTWTFTDCTGTTAEWVYTYTITPPIFTLPAMAGSTVTCIADARIVPTPPKPVNSCGDPMTVTGPVAGPDPVCSGIKTYTWTFTNCNGASAQWVYTYTVQDNVKPTASNPASITVECASDVPAPDITVVTDESDNCSVPTVAWVNDTRTGNCPTVVARKYSVTDACGNQILLTQTITITDTKPPVISTPAADRTIECNSSDLTSALNSWLANHGGAVASDNCSNITWTNNFIGLSDLCGSTGTARVDFRVTDECGNFSVTSASFTIVDTTPPVIVAGNNGSSECRGTDPNVNPDYLAWLANHGGATANDLCSNTITWTHNAASATWVGGCSKSITILFTAFDACNNASTTSGTFTISDTTPPVLAGGANQTAECTGTDPGNNAKYIAWRNTFGGITATDLCGSATMSFTEGSWVTTGCSTSMTVTFTATDACNLTTSTRLTFTILDSTPPTASNPVAIKVECVGEIPAADPLVVTDEADNCSVPVVAFVSETRSGSCPIQITRTYSVTDACGNSINVTHSITVDDDINPVISCPGALTAVCNIAEQGPYASFAAFTAAGGSASDNCGINAGSFIMLSEVSVGNSCPKTVTRTYQIADLCGNTASCTQVITVVDRILPTASNPAPVAVQCKSDVPAPNPEVVTDEADNCSIPVVTFVSDVSDGRTCPETITRSYRVSDACGNSIVVFQTFTIKDTINPTASNPATLTIECKDNLPVPDASFVLDEADNCSIPVVRFVSESSDGKTCPETITRTFSVTDACGNSILVRQTIIIQDITAPVITPAISRPMGCNPGAGEIQAAFGTPTVTDNCTKGLSATWTDSESASDCNITVTRTWSATDACGNIGTAIQTVTYKRDTEGPRITCPAPQSFCQVTGGIYTIPQIIVTDNCSGNLEIGYTVSGATSRTGTGIEATGLFNVGSSLITWTVKDACGNVSSCSTSVTVKEWVLPIFDPIAPICQNSAAPDLPSVSVNGIAGTWSPATINTSVARTTTFTFTPDAGQCAISTTILVTIKPQILPVFDQIGPLWQHDPAPSFLLTSLNGIKGTWVPATISTEFVGTTTYTFTPDPGQCALPTIMIIIVQPRIDPTFDPIGPLCQNSTAPVLPSVSTNGIRGTWSPATISTAVAGKFTFTFTPYPGQGGNPFTMTITINPLPEVTINPVAPLCENGGIVTLKGTPAGGVFSGRGVTGSSFDPAANGPGLYTVTYTYVDPNGCPNSDETVIQVNPSPILKITDPAAACSPATIDLTSPYITTGSSFGATLTYWLDASATQPLANPSSVLAGTYYIRSEFAGTGCFVIKPVTVSIHASPLLVINDPAPVCVPATIDLTDASITAGSTPGLIITYWTDASALIPFLTPSSATNGTYYIMGATPEGCRAVKPVHAVISPAVGVPVFDMGASSIRCQAASSVTYTATASNATSIGYTLDPASLAGGNTINPLTGEVTWAASWTGISMITATAQGCNGPTRAIHTVTTIPAPDAKISYEGTPFCTSVPSVEVRLEGTTGGTFSAVPPGLSINYITGTILPGSSLPGTYTVTYRVVAAGGCGETAPTATVAIILAPTADISYPGPFCTSDSPVSATFLGETGGIYTSEPAGLSIDGSTGLLTPATSIPGTYVVTYTLSTVCGLVADTANITVTQAPDAEISYPATIYCTSDDPADVLLRGTTGGVFTAIPAGLTINAQTGRITPATSAEGNYTVSYTIAAAGGCDPVIATTPVSIIKSPSAEIIYLTAPFCITAEPGDVTITGTQGGTFTSDPGLDIDPVTGRITPRNSRLGLYTVVYTIPATGICKSVVASTMVWILPAPEVEISYPGSPFCTSTGPVAVVLDGPTGGTFTATPAGLTIDVQGTINPSTSAPGTYTITYSATTNCGNVSDSFEVTVTSGPTAEITYPGTPYCNNAGPVNVVITGTAGGRFSATPEGLAIDPVTGVITPGSSNPGTYTISYTNAGVGQCGEGEVMATTTVTIILSAHADLYYAGGPYCNTSGEVVVSFTGTPNGIFSSTSGLSIDSRTGTITLGSSEPGTYTVTYTIPASGACPEFTAFTDITIIGKPHAIISYNDPFCTTMTAEQMVLLIGDAGGVYSSSAGLTIDPVTGAINPSTSKPGSYLVTYTTPPNGPCGESTTTTTVKINALPKAFISYDGPYCQLIQTLQPVTFTGTAGGTYTATPAGLSINATTGSILPSASAYGKYLVKYTVPASGGCNELVVETSITITTPKSAEISYPGSPFCLSITTSQSPRIIGDLYGTYSSTPGLYIDGLTGAIVPSLSKAGEYVVTYTIPASGGCPAVQSTTTVKISAGPDATISYPGSVFCTTSAPVDITVTGYPGGVFTSTPAGLSIDGATGRITPAMSVPGVYTVTYTILASDDCGENLIQAQATLTISTLPVADFAYDGNPYCTNGTNPFPTMAGGSVIGKFTSAPGLVFVSPFTGEIDLAASTEGTYTITNTIPASGGCPAVAASSVVTITRLPVADFVYPGTPYCITGIDPLPVFLNGGKAGTFTSMPAGLTLIDIHTGLVDLSASIPGTYQVTNTIPASGGCGPVSYTSSITITIPPVATFNYPGTPYCSNSDDPFPVFTNGGVAGTFSSTIGLIFIDIHTGQVDLSASTPGTYTVTNFIDAAGGCGPVSATATIRIEKAPHADISYPGSPFCETLSTEQQVVLTGTTGGIFSASPDGLRINPGTGAIIPSQSEPGTYTISYTINTSGACGVVTDTTTVTITALNVSITYAASDYCTSSAPVAVEIIGSPGGVFTSTPAGLTIDSMTGLITPATSVPGIYRVTYTNANSGCGMLSATTLITITAAPFASISYDSPLCQSNTGKDAVILTGNTGGVYSSTPAGLNLDPGTGDIRPSISIPGTYTVSYTLPAAGSCPGSTATASVTVVSIPTASIYYPGSPYCTSSAPMKVILTGTPDGTFTSQPAGLTIDPVTGTITPATSLGGTYTIYYTTPFTRCGVDQASAMVTITEGPNADFTYPGSPYCPNDPPAIPVFRGNPGGTFTAEPAGLSINRITGEIIPATSQSGDYLITYTLPATGGCPEFKLTRALTIGSATIVVTSPKDQTVLYPQDAGFGVRASGGALTYQWQVNMGSGFVDISNTGVYTGAYTDSLHLSSPPVSMSGYRYRVIVNGVCAPPATSGEALLIVKLKEFELKIVAHGIDKMYDGNTLARVTLSDNREPGDVFTVSYTTANFDDQNVGNGKPVSVGGIWISGPDAHKYSYNTTTTTTANIVPKPITVTATPGLKKKYGEADPVFTFTYTPDLIPGDNFFGRLTRVPGENPGLYPILQGTLDLGTNYVITYISNDFEITYVTLINVVVTAGQTKVYGDSDPVLTYSYYPALDPGDSFTGQLGRVAGENVGQYLINRGTLTTSPKYGIYLIPSYFTITPKPITVTAVPDIKVYDGNVSSDEIPVITPNLAFNDQGNFSQTYDHKNVGTGKTMTPSGRVIDGNNGRNYTVTFEPRDVGIITPRPVIGSFTAADKVYDATTDATILSRSLTGAIPGDEVGYYDGTATFDTPTVGHNKTVYGVGFTLQGSDAHNYTFNETAITQADILVLEVGTNLKVNQQTYSHYSDLVTLTATVYGGAPLANGEMASKTASFYIDGHLLKDNSNNANIPLMISGDNLVAYLTVSILETTFTGSLEPGTKNASVYFNDVNINYKVAPNPAKAEYDFKPGFNLVVYPNPSSGPVNFRVSVDVGAITTIDLFSTNGELVARVFEGYLGTGESYIIPFKGHLAQGVYRYRARIGNEVKMGNVVIIEVY